MAVIVKYKFKSEINTLPRFNAAYNNTEWDGLNYTGTTYTGYTYSDINNGDGTTTRTIECNTYPTRIDFTNCEGLLEVLEFMDTSSLTTLFGLFFDCINLTYVNCSEWNVGNVTDFGRVFSGCSSLTTLDLSKWDLHSATTIFAMFDNSKSLVSVGDLSKWNTSNITNMYNMFAHCTNLISLDVSSFNTSNVTDMRYMFWGCTSLTTLELSNFNTSKVKYMDFMFSSCSKLTTVNMDNSDASSINKIIAQLPTRTVDSYGTMTVSKDVLNSVNTTSANSKYWNIIKTPEYSFTLDTLKYLLIKLKEKFALKAEGNLKVDKVAGKDLVTNDYTDSYAQMNQNALNNLSISSKTNTEIQLAFESNNGDNIITIPYDKYKKSALFVDCEENFDCYEGSEYPINYRYVSAIKEGVHKLTVEILRNNEVIKNETNIADNYLYTPNLSDTEIRMYVTDPEGTKTGITYLKPNVKPDPTGYTVEIAEGASYGFELTDDGYYISTNNGVSNSASVCKVNIINPRKLNVYVDCINFGEKNGDYGLLSKINTTLDTTYIADDSSLLQYTFSNATSNSLTNVTVNYGNVEGFIYIKYRKDGSVNYVAESLKFKVRIE